MRRAGEGEKGSKRISLEYEVTESGREGGRRVLVRVDLGAGDALDVVLRQVDSIVKKELGLND